MKRWVVVVMLVLAMLVLTARAQAEFALNDGDTLVFLGDSITAEGTYGRVVELYTLLRFPDRKVRFINSGWGGDTAAGGLARIQKDVFDRGATVLTVAYGINDIGWGTKADAEHRQKYLDSIRGIVEQCKAHHVRVFICSAAVTASDPDKTEKEFLQQMCDDGMKISRDAGEGSIDISRTMRDIQRHVKEFNAGEKDPKNHVTLHATDGIHLSDIGETAMGYAIIKGLGGPTEVSSATIDTATKEISARGCAVSGLSMKDAAIAFDRLDEGLPINFGLFWQLTYRFIPFGDLNRYMLTLKNLPAGKYEIAADGRKLGTWSNEQLAGGIDIASATAMENGWAPGGPWVGQGWLLNTVTQARWNVVGPKRFFNDYLKENPGKSQINQREAEADEAVVKLQRDLAKPVKYHFEVKPAAVTPDNSGK